MSDPAELVRRWLRQNGEIGGADLVLDEWSATDLIEVLRGRGALAPGEEKATQVFEAEVVAPVEAPVRRLTVEAPAALSRASEVLAPAERIAGATAPAITDAGIGQIQELGELRSACLGCPRCRLSETRSRVVFGEGSATADLMVVGEAPGSDKDRTGRPFVGPAGKLLDLLLQSVGFTRESVFICNVLKCRPPGNRNPLPEEIAACRPYLVRQLELIRPRAIFAVGAFATQTLLETTVPISKLRGSVHSYQNVPVVPTYHPAALLRNPAFVRPVWEDLQRLRPIVDPN